jgi:tetratricopeptide (TPR) repeat protein
MNSWFNHKVLRPRDDGHSLAQVGRSAVVAAGFGLLSALAGTTCPAIGDQRADAPSAQTASDEEASLLIATRESAETCVPNTDAAAEGTAPIEADGQALEPTSQSSEHVPELATGAAVEGDTDTESATKEVAEESQFASALAQAAQSTEAEQTPVHPSARRPAGNRLESVPHDPVKFQDITIGVATKAELIAAWGDPTDSIDSDEGSVLSYEIEPFAAVEVLIGSGDIVSTIKVTLAEALEPRKLGEQLSLNEFEPVTVLDEDGQPLGQAFPERGVLFMFEAPESETLPLNQDQSALVSHVAIQPLDARAFALRADNCMQGPFDRSLNDLTTAIALDPDYADAHWMLSGIYLTTGQADSAVGEATTACELEPNNAVYQLRRGQALALLGEYDEAVHTIRAVLDRHDIEPIVRAQALHEMARLASLGDVQIASKSIAFDTRAIEIADRIATSKDKKVRVAAKQLLVEAHMAVAEEIARQAFNQKVESLSLWVGRASGLAEQYIANDGGGIALRLLIAQRALGALASFKPTLDPAPWVAEAEEAANALFAQSDDELWQQHVKWQLGLAYLNALRVEHSRRSSASALRYGQLAVEHLAEGALSRQAVHSSEQLVAQLYFHMGAVHAVHQQDHQKAMPWYDKAVPLLTGPRPVSDLYSPRREGEMLVSIGVTCWQVGQQARALEVTRSGVNLVELAVEDGILAKSALAVPYGNLASMYEQMGESTNAAKYSELAKSVAAPAGKAATASRPGTSATVGTTRNVVRQNGRAIQTNAQQVRPYSPRR